MDCGVCLRGGMAPFALVAGREIASEVRGRYPEAQPWWFIRYGRLSELPPIHRRRFLAQPNPAVPTRLTAVGSPLPRTQEHQAH